MDKVQMHRAICNELASVYKSKNRDYGDSFRITRERWNVAILVRLSDKFERLCTLVETGEAEVDESIEDTLKDLANYCIMELIERGYKPVIASDLNKVEESTSFVPVGTPFTIDNSLIKKADENKKYNDSCSMCGDRVKTLFKSKSGFVCSKCWHKEEDDLK